MSWISRYKELNMMHEVKVQIKINNEMLNFAQSIFLFQVIIIFGIIILW